MKNKSNKSADAIRLATIATAILALLACSETKKSDDIIITKPVKEEVKPTQDMRAYSRSDTVTLSGATYVIAVERNPDASLPLAEDETGCKYHDNTVKLTITRANGGTVYSRTYTKNDFAAYIEAAYLAHNALLGVVYDTTDGTSLRFAASVGSPDMMSDNYIPLTITINTATWQSVTLRSNSLEIIDEE